MAASTAPQGRQTAPDRASKRDTATVNRQLDQMQRAAYQAGLDGGDPPDIYAPDSVMDAYEAGVDERRQRQRDQRDQTTQDHGPDAGADKPADKPGADKAPAPSGPSLLSAGGPTQVVQQGAGFLLGVIAYALVLNYLRYGWPGVTGWMSAKFTNKVTVGAATPHTGSAVLVPNANPAASSPGSFVAVPQQPQVTA